MTRMLIANIALDYIKTEMADLIGGQMDDTGQGFEDAKRYVLDGVSSIIDSLDERDIEGLPKVSGVFAHAGRKVAQNVDLKDLSEMELKKMAIRDNMKAENDAIMMYSKYIDLLPAGDPVRKGLEDIRDEEKEHAGELHQLLVTLDPDELYDFNEGVGEVKREQGIKDAGRKKRADYIAPFDEKWDGERYIFQNAEGLFWVSRTPEGLAGEGDYEWGIQWNLGGSNGGTGFITPQDAFEDMAFWTDGVRKGQVMKKRARRKAASFDWQKENAIPGAWSAKVGDGEYIVLPPEETGFDGYVVYWSSDGYALDDAVGGDLLSPDTFGTADEAKKAAEGWQKSAQSGANDAIEDYFEDTEYDRVGASRKVANGWSTDGITCTLEEDNVKLFVEPELDKWRWDVNVDGELFDTGLADSMPEAQICAEDCAEDAIGHSFIAEKEGRVAKRRRKSASLLLDWQDMGGGQYVAKGDLCDGVVFEDGGSWSWRLYEPKWDKFDDTYGYYGDGFGSKDEAMDELERSLNALRRMFGSSSSKVDEVYNEKWYG